MLHFNFNQVSPSIFDGSYSQTQFGWIVPENPVIGEVVTLGRSKKMKAVFFASPKLEDTTNVFDSLPAIEGGNLTIQYIAPIGGYLLAYMAY